MPCQRPHSSSAYVPHMFRIRSAYAPRRICMPPEIGQTWIAPGRLSAWILTPRGRDGPVWVKAQDAQGRHIAWDVRIFRAHACWREGGGSLPGQEPCVGSADVPRMFCTVPARQVAALAQPRLRTRLPQVAPLQTICAYPKRALVGGEG